MVTGYVASAQVPSGSETVIVVELVAKIAVKGNIVDVPIKSPDITTDVGFEETDKTPVVELKDVAVIDVDFGFAPTHCATRLTNALAD